jgi:hypothetical protein
METRIDEQCPNRFLLAITNFKQEKSAGNEGGKCGWNEAAIDCKAIGACEESLRGLKVAHFNRKRIAVVLGHIRRVGEDQLELLVKDGREKVAGEQANSIIDRGAMGIDTSDLQRRDRDIDRGDFSIGQVMCQGDGNGTGAGTNVDDARPWKNCSVSERRLNQVFGLWPGVENVGVHFESEAIKFCLAGDVLNGLTAQAALEKIAKCMGIG